MEATQKTYHYSQKQLSAYRSCPQILFVGGHTSGFVNCIHCANVFRCYRRLQNEQTLHQQINQSESTASEQVEEKEEQVVGAKPKSLDENGQCTKLMCMKAGWCMCE